jgi:cell wall-associated NlpC family hydrolase
MSMSRRKLATGTVAALVIAAATLASALPGHPAAAARPAVRKSKELPPMPSLHPTVVEPTVSAVANASGPAAAEESSGEDPIPTRAAARGGRPAGTPGQLGGSVTKARALPNGVAVPPLESPQAVRDIIQAGDEIARTPYLWGGGHGKWLDHGYDCSGSVSFVLASAGLLDRSLVAAEFMRWGEPGPGKWVSIYASPTHVFMRVAGIRFDTVARAQTGSRWVNQWTDTSRYVARHPSGL